MNPLPSFLHDPKWLRVFPKVNYLLVPQRDQYHPCHKFVSFVRVIRVVCVLILQNEREKLELKTYYWIPASTEISRIGMLLLQVKNRVKLEDDLGRSTREACRVEGGIFGGQVGGWKKELSESCFGKLESNNDGNRAERLEVVSD